MGRKKCGLLIGMIIVWWMMCFHEQVVKAADYERQDIDSSQEKCEEEENRRRINEVCSELTNVLERYVTAITIVDRQACCQKLEDGYEVNLYDKAGQKVYSTVYPKEPWIKKITEDILEIGISTGSPARYVFYFHKESAKISDTYFNAKLLGNKYVAYMEDKNLIVTDIFREGIIYQRIERDFSETADAMSAVTNIELMEDGSIWLEYYEGLEGEVKTERIVMEEREEGNPAEIEISPAERIDRVVAIDYEFIEKNHKILEYNICTEPRTDYENTALMKYLADDIAHDKEMCSRMDGSTPLEIDYFVYDFNADGLEDYLVCYHGIFWCGSGGNSVTMYIQQEDGTLKRCWGITMRLYDSYLPNEHSPVAVLNETVDGYYSFVIPYSNYIVSYHPETQSYAFDTRDTEQVITDFLDKNPFSFKLSYYENEELNESGIVYCNKESWQCEEGQLDTFQILGEHYEVEDITALRIFKRQENDICGEINIGDELESTDKLLIKYFGDYAISVYCKETEEAQDGKRIVEEISFIKLEVEGGEAPEELYRYLENEYYKIKENQMNLEKRINEKEDAVNRQMQVILEKNQDTITEFLNKYPEGLRWITMSCFDFTRDGQLEMVLSKEYVEGSGIISYNYVYDLQGNKMFGFVSGDISEVEIYEEKKEQKFYIRSKIHIGAHHDITLYHEIVQEVNEENDYKAKMLFAEWDVRDGKARESGETEGYYIFDRFIEQEEQSMWKDYNEGILNLFNYKEVQLDSESFEQHVHFLEELKKEQLIIVDSIYSL